MQPGLGAPELVRAEDVELAVLRDPEPGGTQDQGRGQFVAAPTRAKYLPFGRQPAAPEKTPETPGAAEAKGGTLLSVGSVDPRAPTEPLLETPRLFFTQAQSEAEVYFAPKPLPRATEHATLETETVRIAESADPRKASTELRLRAPGPAVAEPEQPPESHSEPTDDDPQEISTTPEPFARKSETRVARAGVLDPEMVPTQRDLPHHRQSEIPAPRLSRGVEPVELEPSRRARQRRATSWIVAVCGAVLAALIALWLLSSRPHDTSAESRKAAPATAAPPAAEPAPAAALPETSPAPVAPSAQPTVEAAPSRASATARRRDPKAAVSAAASSTNGGAAGALEAKPPPPPQKQPIY